MPLEQLAFGSTGHQSTRAIFGAAALGYDSTTQADVDRALGLVERYGVNHIDTAASYGESEVWLAPWLRERRAEVFLATKTEQRERGPAHDQIRRSLERLGVDQVDLIQLHNLVDRDEWETALGAGGALEAAVEARDEGLVRFIGVTGHGLEVAQRHLESLAEFPFDSVLLPYNFAQQQDERYSATFEELLEECAQRGVAVQTIKSVSKGRWQSDDHHSAPWYEPITDPAAIRTAVAWTLARPGVFLNTVSDVNLLEHVLAAAAEPGVPPSDEQMAQVAADEQMRPLFDAANPV
jgi:aryl-alcohol dehydrogenase-like predicted oxidoreductase